MTLGPGARPVSVPPSAGPTLIAQLEADLDALFREADDPSRPPVTRVCSMNLEVIAPSADLVARYTPVIDEVTTSIPARAILAVVEPDAPVDELRGEVTAVCTPSGEGKTCSERITLACRGKAAARAPSAVAALVVPELPTALVWLGRPRIDDPIFLELSRGAERILLDSAYTSLACLVEIAAWARGQPTAPAIADLAWTRIAVWQELVARFFDDADATPLASSVTHVALAEAAEPGAPLGPEAALMLGWIGTRLGWTIARDGARTRLVRDDGAAVSVEISSVDRPEGVAPQTLARFTVEAGPNAASPALRGVIARELASGLADQEGATLDADVMYWRRDHAGAPSAEQHLRLGPNKAAKWLERTLRRPSHDPAFEESVAFAEQLLQGELVVR